MFVIVFMAMKFFWQIYWFQRFRRVWDERTAHKWEALLERQAKEYRQKALELEGLLIKFGQFLSTRADLLPPAFLREMEGLVDRVEPVPPEYSRATIEREWGCRIEDQLSWFGGEPVASASIGEVFKGYLHNGTPVAVKVQRHKVEKIFYTDFRALRIVFWMLNRIKSVRAQADFPALYRELVHVMSKELDFKKELKHAQYFQERYEESKGVYIPTYYEELSTRRVLVMEWIEGEKVTDTEFLKKHELDEESLAKRVFDLFIDQLLSAGMFHADPHTGNLMVQSDGTLVMIDFGMVGEIKQEDATDIQNIVQGILLEDYDQVIRALKSMDFLLENADEGKVKRLLRDTIHMYVQGDFTSFDQEVVNQVFEDLQEFVKDQPIQLPADYAFLGRAVSIVVGVVTTVFPNVDLLEWGKPVIQRWVGGGESNASIYKQVLKESARPILSLPRSLNEYLTDGQKQREFQQQSQAVGFLHQYYVMYGLFTSLVTIGACMTLLMNLLMWEVVWVTFVSSGAFGIGFLMLLVIARSHFNMIQRERGLKR